MSDLMGDIGVEDRFVIKKRLELEKERILFEIKKFETEILILRRKLEKIEKELESFNDVD